MKSWSAAPTPETPGGRWPGWMVLTMALLLLLWSLGLSSRSLTRPDEGRYAEIAREMAVSGDWITPRLNGIPYYEKPPFQYWATAIAIDWLGPSQLAARLWTALSGALCIGWIGFVGMRLFGTQAGILAALVLTSMIYFSALGHINTLDMGLTFWMSVALGSYLLSRTQWEIGDHSAAERWMRGAWLASAAGFLSKGLVALALPGSTLVLFTLWVRNFTPWRRLAPLSGLGLLLLLTLPWVWRAAAVHPQFLSFFFIHEHLERFTTTIHRRVEPFWYFIPIVVAGCFPWTGILLRAWWLPLRASQSRGFATARFLALYALVTVLFFSLSGSKLPAYVLPAFPALALLVGRQLAYQPRLPRSIPLLCWLGAAVLALGAGALGYPAGNLAHALNLDVDPDMVDKFRRFAPWIGGAAAVWFGIGILGFTHAAHRTRAATVTALGSLLAVQLLLLGSEALAPLTSSRSLPERVPELSTARAVFSISTYDQVLDYYARRTVTLVHYSDELEFGLTLEPALAYRDLEQIRPIWQHAPQALALMEPWQFDRLAQQGWPMRVLFADSRRVIVAPGPLAAPMRNLAPRNESQ